MGRKDWQGGIVFCHCAAIVRGQEGDNRLHSHWASRLTSAVDGELEFATDSKTHRAEAVYPSSKTPHRLLCGFVCSIYFDSRSEPVPQIFDQRTRDGWAAPSFPANWVRSALTPISRRCCTRTP